MLQLVLILVAIYIATVVTFLYAITRLVNLGMEHLSKTQEQAHDERIALIEERDALLERIQRPELRPPLPSSTPPAPDDTIQDELHLVGQIIETDDRPA